MPSYFIVSCLKSLSPLELLLPKKSNKSDTIFVNSSLPPLGTTLFFSGFLNTLSTLLRTFVSQQWLRIYVLSAFLNRNLFFFSSLYFCCPVHGKSWTTKLFSTINFFDVYLFLSCTFLFLISCIILWWEELRAERGQTDVSITCRSPSSPFLCLCFSVVSEPSSQKAKEQ